MSYQINKDLFAVVSVFDQALDSNAMGSDHVRYVERRDPNLVKEKPGKALTWYYLKPLSTSLVEDYIESAGSDMQKYKFAFQFAVARIENLTDVDGRQHAHIEPQGHRNINFRDYHFLEPEQLDLVPPIIKKEIGKIAYEKAFLAHTNGGYYLLPQSLDTMLQQKIASDVVEAQAAVKQKSTQKPQKSTTAKPNESSESPTDATVKAPSKKKK